MSSSRLPTGEFPAIEASGIVAGGSASAEAEQAAREGADDRSNSVVEGQAQVPVKVAPIITVLVVSAFVMILNETLLSVALPVLMSEMSISAVTGQWLSTAFMLTMAVVIPTTGFLMKRLSARTMFTTAMILFLVGTVVAALAPTFGVLLMARVVQAAGTAMVLPLLMTTTLALVPLRNRGTVMGLVGVVISAAPALGPTVSGFILEHWSWQYLFVMMMPIILIALGIGLAFMRNYTQPQKVSLDAVSVVLAAIGFGGAVYGLASINSIVDGTSRTAPLAAFAVGVVALSVFVVRQIRRSAAGKEPLLDLRPLRVRTYTVSLVIILVAMANMLGTVIVLPIYLTGALGVSSLNVGLTLLPGAVASGVLGPLIGRMYDRVGPRPLVVPGAAFMAAVMWLQFALLDADSTRGLVIALNVVFGFGMAMVMTPLMTHSLSSLPRDLYGHGSAILNTLQQLAGALGTAVFIALLSIGAGLAIDRGIAPGLAQADGIVLAFAFGGIWATLSIVLAFTLKRLPDEPDEDEPAAVTETASRSASSVA